MNNPLRLVVGGGFTASSELPDSSGDDASLVFGGLVLEPEPTPEPELPRSSDDSSGSGELAVPEPGAAISAVRNWLSAAAQNQHLGGGPDGLAAHLADPRPEPLSTHLVHARNSALAAIDRENGARGIAAGKAAYHILVALPLKTFAKAIGRVAEILDWAADEPSRLILAVVIIAVIAAVFLLG